MRAASRAAGPLLALCTLAACGPATQPKASAAAAACPPGVVAQTPPGDYAFTDGWVRLSLRSCPGVNAPGATLVAEGGSAALAFELARSGRITIGVLRSTGGRPGPDVQRFPTPGRSAEAREVVLAPLPSGAPATRLRRLRLLSQS